MYTFEIGILRNYPQKHLGVLRGVFKGFGVKMMPRGWGGGGGGGGSQLKGQLARLR